MQVDCFIEHWLHVHSHFHILISSHVSVPLLGPFFTFWYNINCCPSYMVHENKMNCLWSSKVGRGLLCRCLSVVYYLYLHIRKLSVFIDLSCFLLKIWGLSITSLNLWSATSLYKSGVTTSGSNQVGWLPSLRLEESRRSLHNVYSEQDLNLQSKATAGQSPDSTPDW